MSPGSTIARQLGLLRAEVLKLAGLPALHLLLLGTVGASALLAVVLVRAGHGSGASWLELGLGSVGYAQAGFFALGVWTAGSEYVGGQMTSTLLAAPRRAEVFWAKALVLLGLALATAALLLLAVLPLARLAWGWGEGGGPAGVATATARLALPALLGAMGYLAMAALAAMAVAMLWRRSLPALATLSLQAFLLGPLLRPWTGLAVYLPDQAGQGLWRSGQGPLSYGSSWLLVAAWTVGACMVAACFFLRRDA